MMTMKRLDTGASKAVLMKPKSQIERPEITINGAKTEPVIVGNKFDAGKPRHELIAPEFMDGLAKVLTFGAAKYGDRNWEKGLSYSRCFGAMMRHMWDWWRNKPIDEETGMSHLWHAACCLMFLVAYEARKTGTDDRPQNHA